MKNVIVDLGNSLLKGMLDGRPDSAVVIPHALKSVSAEKFSQTAARFARGLSRGVQTDSSMFAYGDGFYMVGDTAEAIGADTRRSGGPKYLPDYYTPLFLAVLLRLLPSGGDVRVMASFPPGDVRHLDTLINSLGGKHVVQLPTGAKVTYKVKQVLTFDEPVGGLWNYLLAPNGTMYARKNMVQGLGLCVDIGGKISSLVPFTHDGQVQYANARSVDLGIQDVMKDVSDILLATPEYDDYFRHVRGSLPFDDAMRQALKTGRYATGGDELNALDAIADATTALRNQLKQVYEQELGGARPYRFIVVTGGGGGLLFAQLVEHVLNFRPDKVYPAADNLDRMHLANLYGGDKALAAMQAKGGI